MNVRDEVQYLLKMADLEIGIAKFADGLDLNPNMGSAPYHNLTPPEKINHEVKIEDEVPVRNYVDF
jgi:hypothetical protein